MIAALFVERGGVYYGLPDVDPWDEKRDARLYAGPWPVVAHPPCTTWGRMALAAFGRRYRDERGNDGGCFAAALAAVRRWGGVLEHPAASYAWAAHGLIDPAGPGAWFPAGDFEGFTCQVEQGYFGHPTKKATWLYAAHVALPTLPWRKSPPVRHGPGPSRGDAFCRLSRRQRSRTPVPFRDLLLSIARSAAARRAA